MKNRLFFKEHCFDDISKEGIFGKPSASFWDGIHLRGEFGASIFTENIGNSILSVIKEISEHCENEENYRNNEPPKKKIKTGCNVM